MKHHVAACAHSGFGVHVDAACGVKHVSVVNVGVGLWDDFRIGLNDGCVVGASGSRPSV
ncbi:MAG TPA: hypothetical protein ACQGQF_04335 [Xylella fastidiosa subsp. pauca]